MGHGKNRNGQGEAFESHGGCVWICGLPCAGKTTLACGVATKAADLGLRCELIDSAVLRAELNRDLGFSKKDRDENVRRIAYIGSRLAAHGVLVVVAAVSPYLEPRRRARARFAEGRFVEVNLTANDADLLHRDAQRSSREQLYTKGLVHVDDDMETNPDALQLNTSTRSSGDCVSRIVAEMRARNLVGR